MAFEYRHFIGGDLTVGEQGDSIEIFDPCTGDVIGAAPAATSNDVDLAVSAARDAFERGEWQRRGVNERANTLLEIAHRLSARKSELAELEVQDTGMPMGIATAMIDSGISALRYYAGLSATFHGMTADLSTPDAEILAYTRPEPVGVVAAITPWNAPFALLVSKIAPALAAGCSVVCKPAEQTPLTALRLGELLHEWKLLPEGQLNIINGQGHTAGAALAAHDDIDKITFTGSTAIGRKLVEASAKDFKRLTLELGGKSPVFIFDDADVNKAAHAAAAAIFTNSGQICFAGSRLYVQRRIFDAVVQKIGDIASGLRLGNGLDPATEMGPLVSEQQMANVLSFIGSGLEEGAELIGNGGVRHGDRGYFVKPTVMANRDRADIRIAREEIFGPVVTAMPFDDVEEVGPLANATEYGLGAGIFTNDLASAHRAAKAIRAGSVWVNCYGVLDKSVPFGGFRQSGWGRECGAEGFSAFFETKAVYIAS
jgi:phenylacetaldehyde dehydrogenase